MDSLQSLDHRCWVPQFDRLYTLPRLIQSDMKRCKWSKHNDPIYSWAEKHFLLQGQNPTISTELPMKVVNVCCELLKAMHHRSIMYSALHLTGPDCTWWLPSVVTVCNCLNLTTEPGPNSSKWQSLRESHRWHLQFFCRFFIEYTGENWKWLKMSPRGENTEYITKHIWSSQRPWDKWFRSY